MICIHLILVTTEQFWQHVVQVAERMRVGDSKLSSLQIVIPLTMKLKELGFWPIILMSNHPDEPKAIVARKVKGRLKVTRAFGVGYLKKKILNDALMGILRVHDLISPPYVSTEPTLNVHKISSFDQFGKIKGTLHNLVAKNIKE
ncbi:hypothetical protein RIF29_12098 [Crotalaria pallida]|uniref:PPM-type phosphatase domain-containing protein n=1 Tax=Crotalaria pallida TaxID=3830 RepID=A0AAN9IMT9_CROPI